MSQSRRNLLVGLGAGLLCLLLLAACAGSRRPLAPNSTAGTASPVVVSPTPRPPTGSQAGLSASARPLPDLSQRLDLGDAIAVAARRNPRLAATRYRWHAATHRPAQAAALPDPLLLYTEMVVPVETRGGPIDREFQLLQQIPFPGKLSAACAIETEKARISRLDYEIALRDTVAEVKVTYAELAYLHSALGIVEQNQAIAAQLAQKAASAYGGAEPERPDPTTLFDTLKAQSQLAQLSYDTVTLQEILTTE